MGYKSALEAAGAKILAYKTFGDYSGEWWALVEYNSERGWVTGNYGSCGVCDAFEHEFEDAYDLSEDELQERLADFGKTYLDGILPKEHFLPHLEESLDTWGEGGDIIDFLHKSEANNKLN